MALGQPPREDHGRPAHGALSRRLRDHEAAEALVPGPARRGRRLRPRCGRAQERSRRAAADRPSRRSASGPSPRRCSIRCGTPGVSIGHQVVTSPMRSHRAAPICRPRPRCSTGAPSPATSRRAQTLEQRAFGGIFSDGELLCVHGAPRGRGDRAPPPLRRLGLPARARREERRRRPARSRRRALGGARALAR